VLKHPPARHDAERHLRRDASAVQHVEVGGLPDRFLVDRLVGIRLASPFEYFQVFDSECGLADTIEIFRRVTDLTAPIPRLFGERLRGPAHADWKVLCNEVGEQGGVATIEGVNLPKACLDGNGHGVGAS